MRPQRRHELSVGSRSRYSWASVPTKKTMTSDNPPIACDLYDYVEIACLYHYVVRLQLLNGDTLTGIAQTTVIRDRAEHLQLRINNREQLVNLGKIERMTALTDGAKFDDVRLNG